MTAREPESALVVDDTASDREAAAIVLRREGFSVKEARSGEEACELLAAGRFDLVLTDLVMPGTHGFDVIRAAQKSDPDGICIVMTSFGSLDSVTDAISLGAYSYLPKPCDATDLLHCVRRGMEKRRLTRELRQRNAELDSKVHEATSELRALNGRILTEMASLKEVDSLKSSFLDHVSHDLKSPLTTIMGYLELLLELAPKDMSAEERRECLLNIRKTVSHMEYLINELLEAAQLTAGKVKLKLRPILLRDVLEAAEALTRPQAEAGGVALEVAGEGSSLEVSADRGRLLQVLSNLLGNACKFTPEGGRVRLRAWAEDSSVHFCVEDTGPGIGPEHLERIFDRFYQVDTSLSRSRGLGLGLRIAKDLVELHKGRIWVESEPGKGSAFHFVIPGTAYLSPEIQGHLGGPGPGSP